MIVDYIVGLFYGLAQWLVGLLPNMPPPLLNSDMNSKFWRFLGQANFFLPVDELITMVPIIAAIYGGIPAYNFVKRFLPGSVK